MSQGICPDCIAENEDQPKPAVSQGLCRRHYTRAYREGRITPRYRKNNGAPCSIDACDRPAKAKGLCRAHYHRAFVGAEVNVPIEPAKRGRYESRVCSFDGCEAEMHSKGLCGGHYWQQKNGRPLTPIEQRISPGGKCSVDACDRYARWNGLCGTHYGRKRRGESDWDRPIKGKAKDGEGHTDKHGYRRIRADGANWLEHIAIAERLLGRPLRTYTTKKGRIKRLENVHHLNGQRDDNRTDGPFRIDGHELRSGNLAIWSKAQPPGQAVPDKLDFAAELYRQYAEFLTDAHVDALIDTLAARADDLTNEQRDRLDAAITAPTKADEAEAAARYEAMLS